MNCRSFILYKFLCNKCNLVYYGKTFRHFKVRVFEHLGKSIKTNKPFTYNPAFNNNTAVRDHLQKCKCHTTIDDFKIMGSANNDYYLKIKESLIIQRDDPFLNKNVKSILVALF